MSTAQVWRFCWRFALIYGLAIAPWPGLGRAYGLLFRAGAKVAFTSFGGGHVSFHAWPPDGTLHDTDVALANPRTHHAGHMVVESRTLGYLPMIFLMALAFATDQTWPRRHRMLILGFLLVHAFIGLRLAVPLLLLGSDPKVHLFAFSPAVTRLLLGVEEVVAVRSASSFVFPFFIWLPLALSGGLWAAIAPGPRLVAAHPEASKRRSPQKPRSTMQRHEASALLLLLTIIAACCGDARAQECYTPREWIPKLQSWNRDANHNFVEDDIDSLPAGSRVNTVLCLNRCPSAADLSQFAAYGVTGYSSPYLTVVELRNVLVADIPALTSLSNVAMVARTHEYAPTLATSGQAVKVRTGFYSPSTVQDAYPAIDGTGVNVAIIDTGVDDGVHESLPASKFVGGYNALTGAAGDPDDDIGHGTHVAGIAIGTGGPTHTNRGIAPGAGLIDIKVFAPGVSTYDPDIIKAIDKCIEKHAVWNIAVINLSLGPINCAPDNGLGPIPQAVNRAVKEGMVVAAASGNTGSQCIAGPGSADLAITVGSISDLGTPSRVDDVISSFSTTGPRVSDADGDPDDEQKPDVVAPGSLTVAACLFPCSSTACGIVSAMSNTASSYCEGSGTSMASPQVAGFAALICQAKPGIDPYSVKQLILDTAEDRGASGWDGTYGQGYIDIFRAIDQLSTTARTDLTFEGLVCGDPGYWWDSTALYPSNPQVIEGTSNTINAVIKNNGPLVATNFKVHLGVYNFGNSDMDFDLCDVVVPGPVPVGGTATVTCGWTPQVSGTAPGQVHACLKAFIVAPYDLNSGNNCCQHNIQIQQTHSPAVFHMQVVNPTGKNITVRLVAEWRSGENWDFAASESLFAMTATTCPKNVDLSLTPGRSSSDSAAVSVRIFGTGPGFNSGLGGVTIKAYRTTTPTGVLAGTEGSARFFIAASPNPFGNGARLAIHMPGAGALEVSIFDVRGRLVRRLNGGVLPAGTSTVAWDGRDQSGNMTASGVFIVQARAGERTATLQITRRK